MNLLNEKINAAKSRRIFFRVIIIECIILSILFSWQYFTNEATLKGLTQEQQNLEEIMKKDYFLERVNYENRKKVLETFEEGRKTQIIKNMKIHSAMNNTLEIIQEITMDCNLELEHIFLDENQIEIKGFASERKDVEKHFGALKLPHFGEFQTLDYSNYSQGRYQFVLNNHRSMKGGREDE